MSKRERHLKQRLDELFSSEPTPEAEIPSSESVQAARAAAELAATPPRTIGTDVHTVIEQMPVPVYVKDREHNWVAVNAAFCQRLGYAENVLVGHVDKEQADELWQLDDQVLENGEADEEQQSTTLPDGTVRTVRTRRVPLKDKDNQVAGLMGIIHESMTPSEVTRVADTDEVFRVAVESMPNPMVITRVTDDLIMFANAAFSDLTGVSLDQLIGQPATNLYADPAHHGEVVEIARRKGAVRDYETRLRHPSNRELWVSLNLRPLRFNNEACVIANVTDITSRKAAEAELIKFKLGIDRANAAVTITDVQGTILYVNPAYERIYGYSREEAIGQNPRILKSGHVSPEQYQRFWAQLLDGEAVTGEIINKANDGRLVTVETNNTPILDENGKTIGFLSIQYDITERKQAETNLRKFKLGLDRSTAAIFITDLDGTITYVNPAFEKIYGFAPEEALGHTPRILKSGRTSPEQYQHLWATLLAGQTVAGEIVNKTKDGELVTIEGSNNPILDENGNIIGFLGLHTDIRARKAAEAAIIERNQQLATLNQLGKTLNRLLSSAEVYEALYTAVGEILDNRNLYVAAYAVAKNQVQFPIYTIDGERRSVASRPFGKGLTEHVIRTKTSLLFPRDVQGHLAQLGIESIGRSAACFMAVPILSGDQVLGVIAVQDYEQEYVFSANHLNLLTAIATQAAAALENARLYDIESKRALQLQTAAAISNAVSTVLSLDELLPHIVELIQERFGLYYVGLFLINWAERRADLRAATGEAGRQLLEQHQRLSLDENSMISWSIAHRAARIALDVGEEAVRFNNPLLPDTRSEVALPLISRGQVLGAMTAQSLEVAAFTDQDISVLQSMADQVANAIANAQLFEQSHNTQAQAEAHLREVQFLQRVSQASSATVDPERVYDVVFDALQNEMGFTHIALIIFDKANDQALVVRASGSASGLQGLDRHISDLENDIVMLIARQGTIEVIDGWDNRFDREIYESQGHDKLVRAFVPLLLRGESIGLLEVGYQRVERARITDSEVRLLGSFADQIAVAVANARLFEESQLRITELAVVNEISRALTQAHGVRNLFKTIHQQVGRLFDASNFYIATYDGGDEWTLDYQIEHTQPQPVTKQKMGGGFTSYILQTRQSILTRTEEENLAFHQAHGLPAIGEVAKSWMGVPLIVAGDIIGVMGIQSYEKERLYSEQNVALFSTIAAQAASALQNLRLYEEARLRADEMAALNELSRTLASRLSMDQVLEEIYHGVARQLEATNFYVALYDAERNEVSFPIDTTQSEIDQNIVTMPGDEGMTGYIIRTRSSLLIKDDLEGWLQRTGLKQKGQLAESWLGVPLLSGGQVLGVIALQSYTTARVYDEHDQAILTAIASQAAIAVQNARLFEQTQKNARELAALNELSRTISQQTEVVPMLEATYQKLQALLPVDAYLIALYDEASKLVTYPVIYDEGRRFEEMSIPLDPESGIGRAIRSGKPELILLTAEELAQIIRVPHAIGNVDKPSASQLYVPMQVGQRVIGALSVQSYQLNAYTEDDIRLIGGVATQAAIALQNVRLFEETRQRNAELATLNQIIGSASETLDLRTLLDMVLKQTLELFHFDAGLITIYNETRHKLERVVRTGLPGEIPSDPAEGLDNSLCAYVFDSQKPLVIEDFRKGAPIDVSGEIETGYFSYIGIPLEAKGRTLGTWCGFRKFAGPFGANTLTLLQAVGHQVSFAIENARLFDETRARVHREQALREITARVRSSMDPEVIVRTAVQDLGQALNRPAFIRLGSAQDLTQKAAPETLAEADDGQRSTPQGGK